MTSRYRVPVLLLQSLVAVSLRFGCYGVLGSRSLCHCADLITLEFQAVRCCRYQKQLSQVISLVVGVVSRLVSSWWRRRALLSLAVGSSSSRLRRHHLAVEVQR